MEVILYMYIMILSKVGESNASDQPFYNRFIASLIYSSRPFLGLLSLQVVLSEVRGIWRIHV